MFKNLLLTVGAAVDAAGDTVTDGVTTAAGTASEVASNAANSGFLGGLLSSGWGIIVVYAAFFGILYLLVIRPNSKKRKQEEELRRNVEIGDEIITIGGIMGRIVSIKDDNESVVIETGSDRVKMRIKRWAIQSNETVREKVEAERAAASSQKKGLLDRLNEKLESKQQNKNK